eukprot:291859_1
MQPVDQNVGTHLVGMIVKPFERLIAELRKLVAKWTYDAWLTFLRTRQHLLESAWDNSGLIDEWSDSDSECDDGSDEGSDLSVIDECDENEVDGLELERDDVDCDDLDLRWEESGVDSDDME